MAKSEKGIGSTLLEIADAHRNREIAKALKVLERYGFLKEMDDRINNAVRDGISEIVRVLNLISSDLDEANKRISSSHANIRALLDALDKKES